MTSFGVRNFKLYFPFLTLPKRSVVSSYSMYKVGAEREGREERRRDTEGPISQVKQREILRSKRELFHVIF